MTILIKTHYRSHRKRIIAFSLVEIMISVVMISIITIGLSLALFRVKEKTESYSVSLTSNQDYQTVLRQIAQDCREANLIRFYQTDNKHFIFKDTETVAYFLNDNHSLIKYVDGNSVENSETLLHPVVSLSFETETSTRNEITTLRSLTIVLTIGLDNRSESYTHTVSLLNPPIWDEMAIQSPLL